MLRQRICGHYSLGRELGGFKWQRKQQFQAEITFSFVVSATGAVEKGQIFAFLCRENCAETTEVKDEKEILLAAKSSRRIACASFAFRDGNKFSWNKDWIFCLNLG